MYFNFKITDDMLVEDPKFVSERNEVMCDIDKLEEYLVKIKHMRK